MMRQVSHKHIVYLYGVCVRDVESKCVLRMGRLALAGEHGGCAEGWGLIALLVVQALACLLQSRDLRY